MKINTVKKIILGIVVGIFTVSTVGLVIPKKAHAILGVGDIVFDLPDTLENLLGELEGSVTAEATLGSNVETTVLDKIATAVAKELLMQVTNSVISWINSGFNGNPAFIQNPTAFFENIGDQATGAFISSTGELSSLCSPFSLPVRLAIASQQQQQDNLTNGTAGNQYSCTLSTIIQNGTNAANGQGGTVQGFLDGDFSQGGWSAFAALTTDPQDSPDGAYLLAEDEIDSRIDAETTQKQNELNQGGGFLSWETCTSNDSSGDDSAATEAGGNDDAYGSAAENDPNQTCSIQTPGSVIAAALNKHLAVPSEELELANSINDIISAAFSELVVVALQKGLTSVTSSSNGGSSYLQTAVDQASAASFADTQKTMLNTVSPYIANAKTIDADYSADLANVTVASTTLGQAISCYQTLIANATTTTDQAAIPYLNNQIAPLVTTDNTVVIPLVETIESKGGTASGTSHQYQQMYNQIITATSTLGLSAPQATLTTIAESGGFPTVAEVQRASNDLTNDSATIKPVADQASQALQKCQSFDFSTFNPAAGNN